MAAPQTPEVQGEPHGELKLKPAIMFMAGDYVAMMNVSEGMYTDDQYKILYARFSEVLAEWMEGTR